jgi:ABC-type maltose transport system permease subunit
MTIPLIAFLFLYLLFVVVWLIFGLVALYHIIRYGQVNFGTFLAAFIYIAGSIVILFFSYQYLSQIDWSVGLTILQGGTDMFGASRF